MIAGPMRAPISIIIPTLNAADRLPGTLSALAEGLEAGLIRELVISDGGSTDATRQVAEDAGALWIEGAAGRGGQLARGADVARGAWLLFLHADTRLGPGWAGAAQNHLEQYSAGYFRLRFRAGGIGPLLVAGWANLRAQLFALPYGDQGLLIPRGLYAEAGGFPDIALMEDVAMARALRGRLTPLRADAWTSAERYCRQGWLRCGARNLLTLTRYLCGTDPDRLARSYYRR